MTAIFEGIFLPKMVFSAEFSYGAVISDDSRSNWLQLKRAVY